MATRDRPLTAVELGLMRGAPPPADRRVTSANWIDPPFNRWGFLHVRELARTARVSRGSAPVHELPPDPHDLAGVPVPWAGATVPLAEALDLGCTDGICVLHDGRIAFERYVDGMAPGDTHLLMSVSKSLTGALIGVLVGEGALRPGDDVTDVIPALRGTPWTGCTIEHLLDMRAGTRFDENDYEDPDSDGVLIDEVSGYRTRRREGLPPDTYAWIQGLDSDREHGTAFEYRSILTDVLAWAAMAATGTRFAELFSGAVWGRLGAEHDADLIVDDGGFPAAEGGFCTTLRDLARFGLMHLQDGEIGGRQVVPTAWVARVREHDAERIAAFEGDELLAGRPNACYRDCWWIWDPEAGIYSGYGINGQQLFVHRPSRTVIARLATLPQRFDIDLTRDVDAANLAIVEAL